MGMIDKYKHMSEEEAINAMIADGLIVQHDADPITGDHSYSLTEKGNELLPNEPEIDRIKRMSNTVYELWQHGMVEVFFDEEDYGKDTVVLTSDAYEHEKVLALPRELQMSLASLKKTFEAYFNL